MIERTKDVTINGQEFQLGRVPADVGNWIVLQMMLGKSTDLDVYTKIQGYLFARIMRYKPIPEHVRHGAETRIAQRVYDAGKWLDVDLQYDLDLMNAVYVAAIDFNFGDFFKKRKAEMDQERLSAETQPTLDTMQ